MILTIVQTIDDLNNSAIILNDITSFEPNDSNIQVVHSLWKELNADALSTDSLAVMSGVYYKIVLVMSGVYYKIFTNIFIRQYR